MMKANLRFIYIFFGLLSLGGLMISCDKDSEDISKVITYPVFEMTGAEFINVKVGVPYTDPGVIAKAGEEVLEVKTEGSVNTSEPGLYVLTYTVELDGDLPVKRSVERKVFVTEELRTQDLYSGTYQENGRTNTMKVTKLADGYYRASDTWHQNKAIPVEFLDYGGNRGLVAFPGSSVFGNFDGTLSYDETAEAFSFHFTIRGGVNDGVAWRTTWKKIN